MPKMSCSSTWVRYFLQCLYYIHHRVRGAYAILTVSAVTLQWEVKLPRGIFPPGRGYHVALLHDARIFLSGGYNGETVFDDFWILGLSASAYLPQVVCYLFHMYCLKIDSW